MWMITFIMMNKHTMLLMERDLPLLSHLNIHTYGHQIPVEKVR